MSKSIARTVYVIGGFAISTVFISVLPYYEGWSVLVYLAGWGLMLYGCYLWTQLKHRHWAWMLFGLLAPIGLIVLGVLKDKTKEEA